MVIEHHPQRLDQGIVILQWFAHSHHHDIRDDSLITGEMFAKKVFGKPKLRNDFTRR
jgi:hypothetical protein